MTDQQPPPPRTVPGRGVRLLTVHRVPIYFSPLTLLFIFFFAASFSTLAQDHVTGVANARSYTLGLADALILMICIVLHELGHALVAQSFRFEVDAISVNGFMGLTQFSPEPQTPGRSFLVSVAGPLVNLVIGGAAWLAYPSVDPNGTGGFFVFSIAWMNIALGVFNLLPGLPLDGGSAFASGVWKLTGDRNVATRTAGYAGYVVAAALVVVGFRFQRSNGSGLYLLLIALLLALGATQAIRRSRVIEKLPGVTAGAVARPAVTVDANLPLSEALRRADTMGVTAVIVSDSSGRPWAVMNGAAVDATPDDRRPWTTINQVSRPIEDGMRIPADLGGQELMQRLAETPASEYVVYGLDGQLTGVLVMVDVVARIDPAAAQRFVPRR
ncbi:MAG TPA: site-2 protease family protein [Frankiaceae bacterium]|nr:site-2 protease family protein [Frankiaceae bacterium]